MAIVAGQPVLAADAASDAPTFGDQIVVTATRVNNQTPITSSIKTTQPQSIINRAVIADVVPATADFNDVVVLTPGASQTTNGNGPGLSESKIILRGFKDGSYNVTFDGVPFGDTNDPTHHSTSYFPNGTYEQIIVERGPGNADNLGQASYGGTINIVSRAVSDKFGGSAEASYGTWNTQLYRGTLQTGDIGHTGIKAVIVGEHKTTDGALSYAPLRADNIFGKVTAPIGRGLLTIVASYNNNYFNQSDNNGATLDQVARFGKNFSLSNPNDPSFATNPYQQTRYDFNFTHKASDFEIIRLEVPLTDHFSIDNRAYTYFYKNYTVSPADSVSPSSTFSTSPKINGTITKVPGNIPGYTKLNQYRVYGNILEGHYDMGFGTLHAGAWLEFSDTHRYRYDYDLTKSTISNGVLVNGVNNYDQKTTGQIGIDANGNAIIGPLLQLNGLPVPQNVQFDENSSWFQQQLFAQFDWRLNDALTITPGVKYINFTRDILSPIATQKARQGTISSANYSTTLPFATVNWLVRDNWSAYAQYAKGFLIPPLSTLEVAVPSPLSTEPTKTTNYQVGSVFAGENLNIDGNVYLIKLSNTIECLGPASALCTNTGHPSTYKGIEGQVSYVPLKGLTLLANGSINDSKDDVSNYRVPFAPEYTALLGVIFKLDKYKFSYVHKFTGKQYADAVQASPIAAYSVGTASAEAGFGPVAVRLTVYNVFNDRSITNISGATTAFTNTTLPGFLNNQYGGPQYFFNPERSFQVTGIVRF